MNNLIYTMYSTSPEDLAMRESEGFKGGNFSADGNYVIGDKGQVVACDHCNHDLEIPSFLPSTYPKKRYESQPTGLFQTVEKIIDGVMIEVEEPIMELVEVFDNLPLTNNHPHYNHEQAKYLTRLENWRGVLERN